MISEVGSSELKRSIESQHGGTATLAQSVPIKETHAGSVVWEGVVHVFDLKDHPTASRAYAWSSPIEGTDSAGSLPYCISRRLRRR